MGFLTLALVLRGVNLANAVPSVAAIPLAVVAVTLAFAAYVGLRALKLGADLRDERPAEVEGRIDLSMNAAQYAASYFLRVGKARFPLKKQPFFALKNGDPYRIYYTRRSKRILSVEWLRENDDNLLLSPDADAQAESDLPDAN